jgi:uncharacterized protein
MNPEQSPLQFPCEFPIKVMGEPPQFVELVQELVSRHLDTPDGFRLSVRESRNARYLSVTITIIATSREQLDAIYRELSAHERVLMAL